LRPSLTPAQPTRIVSSLLGEFLFIEFEQINEACDFRNRFTSKTEVQQFHPSAARANSGQRYETLIVAFERATLEPNLACESVS